MPGLIDKLISEAKQQPKNIAIPEATDRDTLELARRIVDEGMGTPFLIGERAQIEEAAQDAGVSLDGMRFEDVSDESERFEVVDRYLQEPRMISLKGCRRRSKDPLNYAMMLEAAGDVDCTFAGHVATTGEVLMAAQNFIGLKDGVDTPSIMAIVEVEGFDGPEGNTIVFADCGLNPEPDAEALASIAIATADQAEAVLGWDPRVAFLSFSTKGSGTSASTETIEEALKIARERRADLKIDGEFQLDAAIVPRVAERKVKDPSDVAGKANVLIFPDLDAANIAIKTVQLFAHGNGYGHTLSGFKKPVSDSSRNSSVEEMLGDIAMLVLAASRSK
jgi:phosphate acetyltransferase